MAITILYRWRPGATWRKQERSFFVGVSHKFLQVVVATLLQCKLPAAINSRSSIKKITFNLDSFAFHPHPREEVFFEETSSKI